MAKSEDKKLTNIPGYEDCVSKACKNPKYIRELFNNLSHGQPAVRYGAEKALRKVSIDAPDIIYPYFDDIASLLDSSNNFIKWGAIITLSHLAKTDYTGQKKFIGIFEKYFGPVKGPVMITAGNIIGNSFRIALAFPELRSQIISKILSIQKAKYQTAECTNVVIGHALDSLDNFYDKLEDRRGVNKFIISQLSNPRSAVKKRAEKFVRKHGIKEKIVHKAKVKFTSVYP